MKLVSPLPLFCGKHQDCAEVVDVGAGRPGDHQIAQGREKPVAIVVGKPCLGVEAQGFGPGQAVRGKQRAGVVFGPIDSVGVAGDGMDLGLTAERYGQGQQELDIASRSCSGSVCSAWTIRG